MNDCKYCVEQGGFYYCARDIQCTDECLFKEGWQCIHYEIDPMRTMTLAEAEEHDSVNHPAHYTNGKYECIDVIFDILSSHKDPISAWLTGQIIKYLWRWPLKNGIEDLKKAEFYLKRLIQYEEETRG